MESSCVKNWIYSDLLKDEWRKELQMLFDGLHASYTTFKIMLYTSVIHQYGPEMSLFVAREPEDSFLFSS